MHNEKSFKSMNQLFVNYFTRPTHVVPQKLSKLYKFNVNDKVRIDATPNQRRNLSFKYSLDFGT